MFFGTSILKAFWADFGRVLGGQNPWFLQFFREKMEAKNKMIFGRLKNRILRPQEQIADEVRRSVRVRGKEYRDGGKPLSYCLGPRLYDAFLPWRRGQKRPHVILTVWWQDFDNQCFRFYVLLKVPKVHVIRRLSLYFWAAPGKRP